MGRGDGFHFVYDQPKAVTHVDYGSVDRGSGGRIENQSYRVRLSADAEGVDLAGRFAVGNGFADLEHMRAEDEVIARFEMIGIIFHERIAAGQAAAHHLHGADKGSRLPVSFTGESVTATHEPLGGDAW